MLPQEFATLEPTSPAPSSGLLPTLGRHHRAGWLRTPASESLDPFLPWVPNRTFRPSERWDDVILLGELRTWIHRAGLTPKAEQSYHNSWHNHSPGYSAWNHTIPGTPKVCVIRETFSNSSRAQIGRIYQIYMDDWTHSLSIERMGSQTWVTSSFSPRTMLGYLVYISLPKGSEKWAPKMNAPFNVQNPHTISCPQQVTVLILKQNSVLPWLCKATSIMPGVEWALVDFSIPSFLCLFCFLQCNPTHIPSSTWVQAHLI